MRIPSAELERTPAKLLLHNCCRGGGAGVRNSSAGEGAKKNELFRTCRPPQNVQTL